MLNGVMGLGLVLLLAGASARTEGAKKSCCEGKEICAKPAKSGKLRCGLTGTVVDSCCCEKREGKLYCTLAKKNVDSCCCESASKGSGASGEASR